MKSVVVEMARDLIHSLISLHVSAEETNQGEKEKAIENV